jgi:predicted ATPase
MSKGISTSVAIIRSEAWKKQRPGARRRPCRTAPRRIAGYASEHSELTAESPSRLLRDTNRRDEARAMLAEVYNWFTEGFDTADLKDAKALLDELSN